MRLSFFVFGPEAEMQLLPLPAVSFFLKHHQQSQREALKCSELGQMAERCRRKCGLLHFVVVTHS